MIVTETKKHRKQDAVFGEKVGKIFNLVAGKTFRSIFDLKNLLKSSNERRSEIGYKRQWQTFLAFGKKKKENKPGTLPSGRGR